MIEVLKTDGTYSHSGQRGIIICTPMNDGRIHPYTVFLNGERMLFYANELKTISKTIRGENE